MLLVEDDTAIRTTLAEMLRDEACVVTAVGNGRDALVQLRRASPPDVILLDLMMPVMDGWEFRVEQRSDPMLASIPVIAMSADISAKARAIAADAYVRKPIEFDDLIRHIRNAIHNGKRQRLAAADRMAALGTLASGIAHEINNPLTYVIANLQVLSDRLPALLAGRTDAEELHELLADTIEGTERIRRVVKQAQMVAPVQPEERETIVDLQAALEAALGLTVNEIRHRARLTKDLVEGAHVRGDRGRVEQLFLNLLLNAAQAVPEGHANEHEIGVLMRKLPSDRVLIEISDTGVGIAPDVQERVFQPFFTTKPVGQGTGLGLSICQGIVTALGGEISFQSEAGRGTVFRVVLPLTAVQPAAAAAPPVQTARSAPRRVLVVDNETSILRVVRQILEPGHELVTACDAESALAVLAAGKHFDVILCELMLPGQSGMELLEQLTATNPDAAERVVFMTAGAFTPRARRFLEELRRPWLAKPFDRDQLVNVIAAAGGRAPAGVPASSPDTTSGPPAGQQVT